MGIWYNKRPSFFLIWPILEASAEICQIFRSVLGNVVSSKIVFYIYWPLRSVFFSCISSLNTLYDFIRIGPSHGLQQLTLAHTATQLGQIAKTRQK